VISELNNAPSFTKGANITINEDAGAQSESGWATNLSAGPGIESSQVLHFEVSNDNNTLFSVQPAIDASGTLTFTPATDAWGEATVTVVLQDDGGTTNGGDDESTAVTFTITLNDVNDAPSFTKGADVIANEDDAAQTIEGWATDLSAGPSNEAGQSLNFNVSNDNNGLFSMQPAISASGTLTFTPATDAQGSATVTVIIEDDGGTDNGGADQSAAITFTLTLDPVNDAPSFTKGADVTANEDAAPQSLVAWAADISAGPADESGQSLDFQVSNDNNTLFSVQPVISASGTLTFTPAANVSGAATVTVSLQDDGGTANGGDDESTAVTFTITLNDVNDLPSFTKGADVVANEDDAVQTVGGWATNVSAGPSSEAGQSLNFHVSNDNNGLFSVQPAINASGTLTFTPATDAQGSATVTVIIEDDGGTDNGGADQSAAITFTLTLDPVNDAPSLTKGADVTANEDAAPQSLVAWAADISAGPADESGQSLDFQVSNDNNTLFSVQPVISASGTLTFTPAANVSGAATVTVSLQDDGGTANGGDDESTAVTFTITLNDVNDAPSFTKGADVVANEDDAVQTVGGWATNVSAGPSNESGQSLTFQLFNDNNELFQTQPAIDVSGTLMFTPAPDAWGEAIVTAVLHDNAGTANGGVDKSTSVTFTITLHAVNDAPFMDPVEDVKATVNSEPFTITLTGLNPGSGETSQQLTVAALSDTHSLLSDPAVTIQGNGTAILQLVPVQGVINTATITVVIRDDGGTARGGQDETITTFSVTISDAVQAVFMPTLFSPNGDGVNDVFRVRASGIADIRLRVYSAEGHEVFQTTDVITATEIGWNGRYQGRDMPPGIYTWTLQGRYHDGSTLTNGNKPHGQVVLLR
jgi:gliding motility-associated-like protein